MAAVLVLAALSIATAWAFAWMQGRDQAAYVARLHDEHQRERDLWFRERQILLNRIKPETAHFVADPMPAQAPPRVSFDNDEDYWRATETTEELAERLMREELAARAEGE